MFSVHRCWRRSSRRRWEGVTPRKRRRRECGLQGRCGRWREVGGGRTILGSGGGGVRSGAGGVGAPPERGRCGRQTKGTIAPAKGGGGGRAGRGGSSREG